MLNQRSGKFILAHSEFLRLPHCGVCDLPQQMIIPWYLKPLINRLRLILAHSDSGFQYTNRTFHTKIANTCMDKGTSRVAKCIDNVWGVLKCKRYYVDKMIEDYVGHYNSM